MFSYHHHLLPLPFLNLSLLVNKSMIIAPETQNLTDLMQVEQISNSALFSFEDQKYGIICPY